MCRYGMSTYKQHFACFGCRKAFKRRLKNDVDPDGDDQPARCPQCGLLMAEMGLDFKTPRQRATKKWNVVASLWVGGETFHSCGCGGPGYRPQSAIELRAYLQHQLATYRKTQRYWRDQQPKTEREVFQRQDALEAWNVRVERLSSALASVRA